MIITEIFNKNWYQSNKWIKKSHEPGVQNLKTFQEISNNSNYNEKDNIYYI